MKVTLYVGGKAALSYGWGVNFHIPPRPPTWYEPIFAPNSPAFADKKKRSALKKPKRKTVIKTVAKPPKSAKSKDGIGKQPSEVDTVKNDDVVLEKGRKSSPYPTSRLTRY